MRYAQLGFCVLVFLLASVPYVQAQDITAQPICFQIRNTAPYMVYGQVATDYYVTESGTKARHTGTFRLQKAGSRNPDSNAPTDITEFCSTGPFYPGRQVELTLRTLIPIFSCKTNVEMGEIVISGRVREDGTTRTWATCF